MMHNFHDIHRICMTCGMTVEEQTRGPHPCVTSIIGDMRIAKAMGLTIDAYVGTLESVRIEANLSAAERAKFIGKMQSPLTVMPTRAVSYSRDGAEQLASDARTAACQDCHGSGEILMLNSTVACKCREER